MLLRKIIVLVLVSMAVCSCGQKRTQIRPNVVIILADDQGWGDLSVNGNSNLSTPRIDRLADEGVMFDRFYVCAVCSPTRAELLTGRYHVRGGVYSTSRGGERLDLDETTIAEVFKDAGYVTAAYGKWHNGMQAPYHPNTRGFDDFYGFCSGHWGDYFSPMLEHNGEIVTGNGYLTDDLTDHGIDFIRANKGRPFFLYLPFNIPHSPMQVPDKWWKKFDGVELGMRNRDPEKEDVEFTRAALAMCENIDWNVGRVLDTIEGAGLTENTIVIYLSDNGPNGWRWNGGMKGRKGSVDEGGVRSPMIVKWDGVTRKGAKVAEIGSAIDLFPTLVDLAGIKNTSEKPLDGVSLKPLLVSSGADWEDRLLFNHWAGKTSVRSQRYRLDDSGALFDMESDPGQYTDVSGSNPKIAAELRQARDKWRREVFAELPAEDERPLTIGYPGFKNTQLPARDAVATGGIERSSVHPNCSFFTNWTSTSEKITWDGQVLAEGDFEVVIYYTCPADSVGSTFEISFGGEKIAGKITEAHDPPLKGKENNRVERGESYVKDFKPLTVGTLHMKKGKGVLEMKATNVSGSQVMDFRLMMLKRL